MSVVALDSVRRRRAEQAGDAALVQAWLVHLVDRGRAASTIVTHRNLAKHWIRHLDGQAASESAVLAWCFDSELRPTTQQKRFSFVRNLYRWGIAEGTAEHDPTIRLDAPKGRARAKRPLSHDEVCRLLRACRSERESAMVALMVIQGMRAIELERLLWGDIARGTIDRRAKGGHGHVSDRLFLHPQVETILGNYRHSGDVVNRAEFHVLQRSDGSGAGLTTTTILGYVTAVMDRSGVRTGPNQGRSPHALRATAGVAVYEKTGDVRDAQQVLGHRSPVTTAIYLQRAKPPSPEGFASIRYDTSGGIG